ncbi:MAG: thiamine pyrophosphate-dependent enzyme [Omnitrophica bacterium]|nr:thiamine pyrophosphate-dependent enzyme [Candidatus Omnitrophota bacterium]
MKKIFSRPKSLRDVDTHYCPGCGHGVVHRLICEIIDELGIREKTIAVAPVGCAVIAYDYWNFDCCEAAHGRAMAVAVGIKRTQPERVVFTYQGDGDLAAIGTAETIHAANRGENLSCVFINNAVYGMTGGQMAPTTVIGQKTTTTPLGRNAVFEGYPLKVCELLASFPAVFSLERVALDSAQGVMKTKKAINQVFLNQLQGKGFSLVEILSACPVCWGRPSGEAWRWVKDEMVKVFPLGRFK